MFSSTEANSHPVLTPSSVGTNRMEWLTGTTLMYFMLGWALIFLVIAIIAAIFGFGGIAGTAAGIAQVLFYIFIAIFVISLLFGLARGRRP
jgi:uncharacterized membrane protein YtjA (UPF0391 family)